MNNLNAVSRRWLGVGYSAESDARAAGAAAAEQALRRSDAKLVVLAVS